MTVTVRGGAESDLEEVFDHYDSARRGLGTEFLIEFRKAVDRIVQNPRAWQPLDQEYRRCRLHRFPYGAIYRLDASADQIVVVAVHHFQRKPDGCRKGPGR